MGAIFSKEIKSFFNSMLGYVFCAVMIILIGIYFYIYNLSYGYPRFSYSLMSALSIMMFATPLLTMRSFAEERKSRTDQMLLTTPVRIWQIVPGKFLAYAVIYAIPLLVSCLCPLIINLKGSTSYLKVDYLTIFTAFFFGLVYISIGVFISSLTESQIIAAVGSFAAVFLLVFWSGLTGYIPNTVMAAHIGLMVLLVLVFLIIYALTKNWIIAGAIGGAGFIALLAVRLAKSSLLSTWLNAVTDKMDLSKPISNIAYYNLFDISGIVMYISIIFVFLMLTVSSLNKRRWS